MAYKREEAQRRRQLYVGIDPGLRNLSMCVIDPATKNTQLYKIDLLIQVNPKKNVLGIVKFEERCMENAIRRIVDDFDHVFSHAKLVAVETQMRRVFIVFQRVLIAVLNERHAGDNVFHAIPVSPKSVRAHFKISSTSYAKRKKASVDFVTQKFGSRLIQTFKQKCGSKIDDVCEALLLTMYAHLEEKKLIRGYYAPLTFSTTKLAKTARPCIQIAFCLNNSRAQT